MIACLKRNNLNSFYAKNLFLKVKIFFKLTINASVFNVRAEGSCISMLFLGGGFSIPEKTLIIINCKRLFSGIKKKKPIKPHKNTAHP